MNAYNGHRSWNAWNVSLWINNEEWIYRAAQDACKRAKGKAGKAAILLLRDLPGRTPDGAKFNYLSVKLAIEDIAAEYVV